MFLLFGFTIGKESAPKLRERSGEKRGRQRAVHPDAFKSLDEVHFSLSEQGWTLCIFMVNLFTEPLLKFWKQRKCICSITFPDLTSPIKSIKAFNEIPAQSQLP